MGMEQGYRLEIVLNAPREAVWRALTDADEILRWFGWDYESIVPEIKMIFFDDDVAATPPERLALGWEQTIDLIADGDRTILRIVKPGPLAAASWDDLYDEVVRGWHGFFLQLKHYLERHPGEDRRTLWLDGTSKPSAVLSALDEIVPGETWLRVKHQRVTAVEAYGGGLVNVLSAPPLDADEAGKVQVTITTHGLTDEQFAALRQTWAETWEGLAPGGSVTP